MFIPIAIYIHLVHSECITTILCCDLRKKNDKNKNTLFLHWFCECRTLLGSTLTYCRETCSWRSKGNLEIKCFFFKYKCHLKQCNITREKTTLTLFYVNVIELNETYTNLVKIKLLTLKRKNTSKISF